MKKSFLEKSICGKRAQSELIAYVLLIGLAVTLAVLIGRWSLQQAQSSTEHVEEMIMGDVQCADIAISGSCEDGKVTNRGTLTIYELRISGQKELVSLGKEGLKPKAITDRSVFTPKTKVKIMPIIHVNDKKIGCDNKEIEVCAIQT